MTAVTDYTALLSGNSWNGLFMIGTPCVVTYSFNIAAPQYVQDATAGFTAAAAGTYQQFNATEMTAARDAMAQWAAVCGIKLIEVAPGEGEIALGKIDLDTTPNPDSGGFALFPTRGFFLSGIGVDSADFDGDVFLDSVTPPTGTSLAYTLLHEIGHTLGLKHPFEGDPTYAGATTTQTVMQYGAAVSVLGSLDPQAAVHIYGGTTAPAGTLVSFNYNTSTKVLTQNWGSASSPIMGTGQKDVIDAGAGADRVAGFQNDDILKGGAGNDQLYGGDGNDILAGGSGDDIILGGRLAGENAGTDTADYSAATAAITVQLRFFTSDSGFQATGADIGNDLLYEIDNVIGGTQSDSINGNQFANSLFGGAGNDTLSASLGNDRLDGGTGIDTMIGGVDNDTYVVDNAGDVVDENADGGDGTDLVQSSVTFSLADTTHAKGTIENLTLAGSAAINGIGNTLNNVITGNGAANVLNGGAGADSLVGGLGNDTFIVDNTSDHVFEAAAGGTDTVLSLVTFTLGSNLENLKLAGSAAINGTGNTLANTITGNNANNTLNGGTGADTMLGGFGNDTYIVDNASDHVFEVASAGTDRVISLVTHTLAANVENLTLAGAAAINGTGNTLNNTIIGNGANNLLNGVAGADTLNGSAGLDVLIGGLGRDIMTGGTGNDRFDFNAVAEIGNTSTTRDVIVDFTVGGDDIDLSTIDANGAAIGNTGFSFLIANGAAFTGVAGQLRWFTSSGNTFVEGDTDGNHIADFQLQLLGSKALTAGDFIL